MKLPIAARLLMATSALIRLHVTTQAPIAQDARFKSVNCYTLFEDDPNMDYFGGMFFNPEATHMYIVRYAEDVGSYVAKVPVIRNTSNGRIEGFGSPEGNDTYENVFARDYLNSGFRVGAGGRFYYAKTNEYSPVSSSISQADVTFGINGSITFNEIYDETPNIYDITNQLGYSVSVHPIINNPSTGTKVLLGGAEGPVYILEQEFNATLNAYVNTAATLFMNTNLDYVSDLAFVPSGSFKNDIVTCDYVEGTVIFFPADATTGYPIDNSTLAGTLGTENPQKLTLFTNVTGSWGVVFDPVTNDFFVNTWAEGTNAKIFQIRGFPPGNDVDLLIQILNDALGDLAALVAAASSRVRGLKSRTLKKKTESSKLSSSKLPRKKSSKTSKGGKNSALTNSPTTSSHPSQAPTDAPSSHPSGTPSSHPSQAPTGAPSSHPSQAPSGAPSSHPSQAPSGAPSSHPSGAPSSHPSQVPTSAPFEANLPAVEDLTAELLNGDATSITQAVEDTFKSGSFQAVLNGESSDNFEDNVGKINYVALAVIAAKPDTLTAAQEVEFDDASASVTSALAAITSIQEQASL